MPLKTTIRSNEHALVKNFIKENNEDSSEEERYMIGKSNLHLKDLDKIRVNSSRLSAVNTACCQSSIFILF